MLPTKRSFDEANVSRYSREYFLQLEKREEHMVRLIKGVLQITKQASVPCIVGFGHAQALRERLALNGVSSRVNVSFFKETRMADMVSLCDIQRRKALEGNWVEAKRLDAEIHELSAIKANSRMVTTRVAQMVTRIAARKVTARLKGPKRLRRK